MLAALPPAFPTVCDLNTGNLEEGEGVSAELTYFAGPGLGSFPSPQQMGLLVPTVPNLHGWGPEPRLRPPPQTKIRRGSTYHMEMASLALGVVVRIVLALGYNGAGPTAAGDAAMRSALCSELGGMRGPGRTRGLVRGVAIPP